MRYSNIKRVLSVALLVALVAPSAALAQYGDSAYNGEKSLTLSGDVHLTDRNDKITLSLRDSDVKQVLRMFADKAGLNIVFHESVNGRVTLDLVETPINEAFDLVLQVSRLNYYMQRNTMVVMSKDSPDNAAFSKQEMLVFPVQHVSATKIAEFLNQNVFSMRKAGLSGVDAATANVATNELVVFGMPGDVEIVKKVIEQFDREPVSRTYTVNHTTPAQMASMICDVLLPARGVGDQSSAGGAAQNAGAIGGAGVITGGAASVSEGGSTEGLVLGEGVVACTSRSDASGSVAPFSLQGLSISYFPQKGTITMMGGSEAQARMIEEFIKKHDIKQPQAMLEISIVELNESGSKAFQNQWAISTKAWGFNFDGTQTSGGRRGGLDGNWVDYIERAYIPGYHDGNGDYIPGKYEEVTAKRLMPSTTYIQWTMNYLIENRKGRVLANPKIMITNGQESVIDLTQDYIEKVDTQYRDNAVGFGADQVQREYSIKDDLGIKVNLTPFISQDGYVTLNIKPDYTTIQERVVDSYGMPSATLLSRRNLDLKNVRIKDGETLVLGGLIQEQEQKTVAKIPVLGDLPIIGSAFRSTSTSKAKSELVIMITPRILTDGDGSVASSL